MCRAARLAKPRVLRALLLRSIDGWGDRVRIGGGERGVGILGPHAGLEPQLAYVSLLIQSCRYFSRTLNATGGDAALATKMDGIADSLAAKLRARPSAGQHRPGRLQTSCLAGSAFSHRWLPLRCRGRAVLEGLRSARGIEPHLGGRADGGRAAADRSECLQRLDNHLLVVAVQHFL